MKRLRIQGSTMRLRSISRLQGRGFQEVSDTLSYYVQQGPSIHTALRFGELLSCFTGKDLAPYGRTFTRQAHV